MSTRPFIIWILRLIPAIILLQTLFFKFTASEESVFIFSQVGLEPWGRILTGIAELIAAILILIPRTSVIGAVLAAGIMGGAILSHLFVLGIEVQHDGGLLFVYACVVLLSCLLLIILLRNQFQGYWKKFFLSVRH